MTLGSLPSTCASNVNLVKTKWCQHMDNETNWYHNGNRFPVPHQHLPCIPTLKFSFVAFVWSGPNCWNTPGLLRAWFRLHVCWALFHNKRWSYDFFCMLSVIKGFFDPDILYWFEIWNATKSLVIKQCISEGDALTINCQLQLCIYFFCDCLVFPRLKEPIFFFFVLLLMSNPTWFST